MKMLYIFSLIVLSLNVHAEFMTCQTSKCHQGIDDHKYLHAPFKTRDKACLTCHVLSEKGIGHPIFKPLTNEFNNDSCKTCHESSHKKIFSKNVVHKALVENACTSCHSPHGSDHPKLLKKGFDRGLCLDCHKKTAESISNVKFHKAESFNDNCLTCHNSHNGSDKKLLKDQEINLCLGCHGNDQVKHAKMDWTKLDKKNWHEPVKDGNCSQCHQVHGSKDRNLLKSGYKNISYSQNIEEDAKNCFECHKVEKFQNKHAVSETQFRNGNVNLHFLHLNSKNGSRNCHTCHEVHASNNLYLIKDNFQYRGVQLPIKFNPSKDGGTCTTACHKAFSYDRTMSIKNENDL